MIEVSEADLIAPLSGEYREHCPPVLDRHLVVVAYVTLLIN